LVIIGSALVIVAGMSAKKPDNLAVSVSKNNETVTS
jgi:hypothetical protein